MILKSRKEWIERPGVGAQDGLQTDVKHIDKVVKAENGCALKLK
jgi:hypothetical protein